VKLWLFHAAAPPPNKFFIFCIYTLLQCNSLQQHFFNNIPLLFVICINTFSELVWGLGECDMGRGTRWGPSIINSDKSHVTWGITLISSTCIHLVLESCDQIGWQSPVFWWFHKMNCEAIGTCLGMPDGEQQAICPRNANHYQPKDDRLEPEPLECWQKRVNRVAQSV
jgi:hypothetical protein